MGMTAQQANEAQGKGDIRFSRASKVQQSLINTGPQWTTPGIGDWLLDGWSSIP